MSHQRLTSILHFLSKHLPKQSVLCHVEMSQGTKLMFPRQEKNFSENGAGLDVLRKPVRKSSSEPSQKPALPKLTVPWSGPLDPHDQEP